MVTTSQVADYFSRILRRGTLDPVSFGDSGAYIGVDPESLRGGRLPEEDTEVLFADHRRKSSIDVVLSCVSLARTKNSGGVVLDGLALLGATLFRDGRLSPVLETGSSPWIPSERLAAPSVSDLPVMVGSLAHYWARARTTISAEESRTETFAEALDLTRSLFERVAGTSVEDFARRFSSRAGVVEHGTVLIRQFDRINAVGGLLDVYDHLGSLRTGPPLVERLALGHPGPRRHEGSIHSGTGLRDAALRSCGSMSDGFPLTDSQRRAVHAYLTTGAEDVTAVSGPPGTGKTTMLQSIVANLLTRHALEKADAPVIVGTSTNNQAVTNIISSFASVTKDEPGLLDLRWLPAIVDGTVDRNRALESLAVYCPSKAKLEDSRAKYLVEQTDKGETYTAFSDESYIAAAKDVFVRKAYAYFGIMNDVPQLQEKVHEALEEIDRYRTDLLRVMSTTGPSPQYAMLCARVAGLPYLRDLDRVEELADCRTLEDLDRKLDVTLRYAEFWLAVHYYEAAWLLVGDDRIAVEDRRKNTPSVMEAYWTQAAALTPCFVMTVYQVPKYFRLFSRDNDAAPFDFGRIDLLIVDEAGQVDTPLGVPAFALASSAVVVGDEKQLAPVWSIDELTDREVAQSAGIHAADWDGDLRRRGATASAHSSLMRAASHGSAWCYGKDRDHLLPGLFLAEHFRCHPDIIGFCNDLLYDGLLRAERPASSSKLDGTTPAFHFIEVPGSEDSRYGTSRRNAVEAEAIAQWIVQNYARLFDLYHTQVDDPNKKVAADELIGVVTPFSAQARLIEQEIRKTAREAGPEVGLPEGFAKKITVGTAHRLQGAERPVVLFSAAYGTNSPQASFIDASPELMNVAVSRAKDLFLVFAAGNRWNKGDVFSVMSRFARRTDGNVWETEPAPGGAAGTDAASAGSAPGARTPFMLPATDFATLAGKAQEAPVVPPRPTFAPEPPVATATDAGSAVGPAPAEESAAAPTVEQAPMAEPAPSVVQRTVSGMLGAWREAGALRDEDAALKAAVFNTRLREVGVLEGEPGSWAPSPLAQALGVVVEERRNSRGEAYTSIEYTSRMQNLLLDLYREGTL